MATQSPTIYAYLGIWLKSLKAPPHRFVVYKYGTIVVCLTDQDKLPDALPPNQERIMASGDASLRAWDWQQIALPLPTNAPTFFRYGPDERIYCAFKSEEESMPRYDDSDGIESILLRNAYESPLTNLQNAHKHALADFREKIIIFDSSIDTLEDYEPVAYFFVNTSLDMGKGKIAAQVGHAVQQIMRYMNLKMVLRSRGRFEELSDFLERDNIFKTNDESYANTPQSVRLAAIIDWDLGLSKKIVLKATKDQLAALAQRPFTIRVYDAGLTQIEPGSLTVVAMAPRYAKHVPKDFKGYKLL